MFNRLFKRLLASEQKSVLVTTKTNEILYGKCKGYFQSCTKRNWCSFCEFQNNENIEKQTVFKTADYDLNWDERKVKYKDYDLIFCGECQWQFDCYLFIVMIRQLTKKNRILYGKCKK